MFTIRLQTKNGDNYVTVKQITVKSFDNSLAEKAEEISKAQGLSLSLNIAHEDTVPAGFYSKRLEFTTSIWRSKEVSVEEALAELEMPF